MSTEPKLPQSIFRVPKPKIGARNYVRIDNAILQDKRLSFRARGVAAFLLSEPDNWQFSAERMASHQGQEGEHSLEQAIRELIELG